jgi:4-hydroxy-tetrahydrodipicolinate synthase
MIYPASVTPFAADGCIDYPSVVRLLAWFRASGCDGVVLAGTNGEGPSLSAIEKRDLVRHAVAFAEGLKVILGIATSSITEAIWLSVQARKAGAEAVLVMPPSYWPECGQDGVTGWFEQLMDQSETPTLIYNFPKRVGFAILPETVRRLSRHPYFYGVKDSSGIPGNLSEFARAASGHRLFCGDEGLAVKAHSAGWTGLISGAANVLSSWLVPIWNDLEERQESGEAKFDLIAPAIQGVRSAPQPYANKEILHRLGVLPNSLVRLPLRGVGNEALEEAAARVTKLVQGTTV